MSFLRISLFGSVKVFRDENRGKLKLNQSIQKLFAYLVLFRHRTHPREVLAEVFWGEKNLKLSRGSLNTALWQLRNALEPKGVTRGTYLLSQNMYEVGFNQQSPFWLDVHDFWESTSQVFQSPDPSPSEIYIHKLEHAVSLYKGELLEAFYDDWVLREREILRARYISTLACLMGIYCNRNDYEKSLSCGLKILEFDPLREEVHRYLMKLYMGNGQRGMAIRQYETCRESIKRELGIAPMEETRALFKRILSPEINQGQLAKAESPKDLSEALEQLHNAHIALEQAQKRVNRSIQIVKDTISSKSIPS
jgi:DNA-binding SARP family transcriptional activator